jgi:hypothetical protein
MGGGERGFRRQRGRILARRSAFGFAIALGFAAIAAGIAVATLMEPGRTIQLRTIGHACLLILEDGEPIIATDPWLIGSVYWRSWWLEKYPSDADIDLVRRSRFLYVTHSHVDHPSLRRLGPHRVLHPAFPNYAIPGFLKSHGFLNRTLTPLARYSTMCVSPACRCRSTIRF